MAQEELAAQVGVSPNHLIRLFRKELQTTPQQLWDRLRLEHARSHLRQPDVRVKEVAIDLGFKHLSHFSKWFKKHTGKTAQSLLEPGGGDHG
jgi:transcriptional regulator GlxA family with amidase domain